jgi:5-exo-hydroxycamphor dehydrogenase
MILGHEFIGRVQSLGDGDHLDCLSQPVRVGDRVVVNVVEPCGQCILCKTGGAASCLNLINTLTYTRSPDGPPHFHGGYAEVTIAPTRYLHKIPESIATDVVAAFLCAGPTIVRGVVYAGGIQPGDHVIVQGSGPVGLFAVLYATRSGAGSVTMIGSGSNPLRLDLARELGADTVLDIRRTSADERRAALLSVTDGIGVDLIIEGTGSPDAIPEGLSLLRPRGRYVWAGQYSDRGSIPLPTQVITFNALQIFGSAQFTVRDRADYVTFLEQIPDQWNTISGVITDRYMVDDANEALARARSGESVKSVFVRAR